MPPVRWRVDPLSNEVPDLVVLPTNAATWMLEPGARVPIWWHEAAAIYAPAGNLPRLMDTPPSRESP